MPELTPKNGWTRVVFGDVARLCRERSSNPEKDGFERFVGLEHIEPGSLKIRQYGDVADGTTFTSIFRSGQVLFGKRRAYQRKVAVADFDGVCSSDIYVLEAKNEHLLPNLLPFICQTESFFQHAVGTSAGSLSPRTNWESLAGYEFALPPLGEQRRIADLVSAAEQAIDALVELLKAIRLAEGSLFEELVARCSADDVNLGSLLTESPRNGCSAIETSAPTGHWVLALSALTKWGYRSGELKAVEKTDAMSAAILRKGDLLISRSNTRELVGLPGIFDEDRSDVSWPDTMMRLSPDECRVRKRFLELYLRAPKGRRQVQSFAAGTSASMKKINGTNVKKLLIPLPKPEEQASIECKMEPFRLGRVMAQRRIFELMDFKRTLLNQVLAPSAQEGS